MTGGRVSRWHVGIVVFALCLCIPALLLNANEKADAPAPKVDLVPMGTFWLPDVSSIEDGAQPEPLGACCGPFGIQACEDNTGHVWCEQNGGVWMGAGSVCTEGLCATPVQQMTWGAIKALYR